MSELIDSDVEMNHADASDDDNLDNLSLEDVDSDEERKRIRKQKENAVKINNSYTGPYPLDPTDFNHNDKGSNPQFGHM